MTTKFYGPYVLEMKINVTNGDQSGEVTYRVGVCGVPSSSEIKEGLENVEKMIKEKAGDDWGLATRTEFFDALLGATDGKKKWDEFPRELTQ